MAHEFLDKLEFLLTEEESLDEDEKEILDMRKAVIAHAQDGDIRRQAATLGLDAPAG